MRKIERRENRLFNVVWIELWTRTFRRRRKTAFRCMQFFSGGGKSAFIVRFKRQYIDRARGRPPRGKIESVRTHSEVIGQFDSFSLLKLLFLVRNWHCWSGKAFPRQMTPQSHEDGRFSSSLTDMKSCTVDHGCTPAPKDATKLESFLWHVNEKQRAEVIFRPSRTVSCKYQENGAAKQWSLHAPLTLQ